MRLAQIVPAAVLAAIAAPAPAQAATISPSGVRSPDVAVNAAGATLVAWERATRTGFAIEARTGAGPGSLGRTARLAQQGYAPRVAIGADGTRAVMWFERGARTRAVRVAVARPGHGFGRGQLLERRSGNIGTVDVAVQPTGRVVAVWQRTSNRLAYALAPRNRAFGAARELTRTGSTSPNQIALDPRDGAVVLAYGTPLGLAPPLNQQAGARTLATTSTTFSAPVVLSDPSGLAESYPVIVGGSGGVGVAFTRSSGARTLNLARRTTDGTWSAPQLIASPPFVQDVFAVNLMATLPADGGAFAAWSISAEPGGRGSISKQTMWSIAAPSAAFGAPVPITPANDTYGAIAVASAGADAFLATAKAHGPVILAMRSAGSAVLGPPRLLTADGDGDVVLAAAGSHVLAAWQQADRLRIITVH